MTGMRPRASGAAYHPLSMTGGAVSSGQGRNFRYAPGRTTDVGHRHHQQLLLAPFRSPLALTALL